MNLDLVNSLFNDVKSNKVVQNFVKELQNYLENYIEEKTFLKVEREDFTLFDPIQDERKITTEYRDKMLLERNNILNNYAEETQEDKGDMYYIYSQNSKMENGYNLCNCKNEESHNVIEEDRYNLPEGATIGSILRKENDKYILDEEATEKVEEKINTMKEELLEEQTQFLESKRIEGHVYELSEKDTDRAWLFDITNNEDEALEEIDFPQELLNEAQEGDLFIYSNGEYTKK